MFTLDAGHGHQVPAENDPDEEDGKDEGYFIVLPGNKDSSLISSNLAILPSDHDHATNIIIDDVNSSLRFCITY